MEYQPCHIIYYDSQPYVVIVDANKRNAEIWIEEFCRNQRMEVQVDKWYIFSMEARCLISTDILSKICGRGNTSSSGTSTGSKLGDRTMAIPGKLEVAINPKCFTA